MQEKNIIKTIENLNLKYIHPKQIQMENYFNDKCPDCGLSDESDNNKEQNSDIDFGFMGVGDKCGKCDYVLTKNDVAEFEKIREELKYISRKKIENDLKSKMEKLDQEKKLISKGQCPACTVKGFSVNTKCRNCGFEASLEQKN
jgi:hypothetical protein